MKRRLLNLLAALSLLLCAICAVMWFASYWHALELPEAPHFEHTWFFTSAYGELGFGHENLFGSAVFKRIAFPGGQWWSVPGGWEVRVSWWLPLVLFMVIPSAWCCLR